MWLSAVWDPHYDYGICRNLWIIIRGTANPDLLSSDMYQYNCISVGKWFVVPSQVIWVSAYFFLVLKVNGKKLNALNAVHTERNGNYATWMKKSSMQSQVVYGLWSIFSRPQIIITGISFKMMYSRASSILCIVLAFIAVATSVSLPETPLEIESVGTVRNRRPVWWLWSFATILLMLLSLHIVLWGRRWKMS